MSYLQSHLSMCPDTKFSFQQVDFTSCKVLVLMDIDMGHREKGGWLHGQLVLLNSLHFYGCDEKTITKASYRRKNLLGLMVLEV